MAVDSKAKRLSAQSAFLPVMAKGVVADGSYDQADRQDAAWIYRGILAGLAVDTRRYVPWKRTVGRKRWR